MIGAAPLDDRATSESTRTSKFRCDRVMRMQRKILPEFGATLDNVVEEVLYVTDIEKAFAAAGPVRK